MAAPRDSDVPNLYGNIFQITRTPWDVTLHVLHGAPPLDAQAGDRINLIDHAAIVARITLPLAVGKLLIKALEMATSDDAIHAESVTIGPQERPPK